MSRRFPVVSAVALVAVNLVPLGGVLFFGWSLFTVLFLYWIENGIVGLFNIFKIALAAKPSSSDGSPSVTGFERFGLIVFFIFHYGIFWIVHGVFVIVLFGIFDGSFVGSPVFMEGFDGFDLRGAIIAAAAMILSHGFSFFYNYIGRKEYLNVTPSEQMSEPYSRVMALHVTILGGGYVVSWLGTPAGALVVLVVVKIAIDLRAHVREHRKATSRPTDEQTAPAS